MFLIQLDKYRSLSFKKYKPVAIMKQEKMQLWYQILKFPSSK